MVAEHARRGFSPALLPATFSLQVLSLGATAVVAGWAAGLAVEVAGGGSGSGSDAAFLAPFDLCAAAAGLLLFLIPSVWRAENFGAAGQEEEEEGGGQFLGWWAATKEGLAVFTAGQGEVLWLGLTQVCFEGAHGTRRAMASIARLACLLIFHIPTTSTPTPPPPPKKKTVALFTWVFIWTPALEAPGGHSAIPHLRLGLAFATLMVGVTAGGAAFRLLVVGHEHEQGQGQAPKDTKETKAPSSFYSSEDALSGALALAAGSLACASLPGIRGDALLLAFVMVRGACVRMCVLIVIYRHALPLTLTLALTRPSKPPLTPYINQFETAFGIYTGAMSDLRARLLPEARRATVMNQTRLVLNAAIVGMYLGPLRWEGDMGEVKRPLVLGLCTGLVLLAGGCHARLRAALAGGRGDD